MSIHKLSAGSGYDYLTRQVAALDATENGQVGLASYYTERGENPGAWIGSGLAGIDGVNAGDAVTAEQMRALFGAGMHPLATKRLQQLAAADLTDTNIKAATRLGALFKVYAGEVSPFRIEVAKRIATRRAAAGQLADESVSAALRAQVRTEVAWEFFRAEHGRDPVDAREIAATIAKQSRPRTQTVAGYDLTFSPVKSVSTLWAVADPHVAAQIELSHQAAVQDALTFIERHALFTRQGRNGIRQVNVRGLVAAAFTHRDSRAGEPDLHTHVAVANKVQTLDGRWLAIDGRVLFKATVAASAVVRFVKLGMGGPAAWLGVGNRPLFPCCWAFPVGRVSDARSSLICAGWLPQDRLFDWNGHHCLQKANVASRGWLFIGLAWIPFLARVPDSTCRQGHC